MSVSEELFKLSSCHWFIMQPFSSKEWSHPFIYDAGLRGFRAVACFIKVHLNHCISWKTTKSNREQSIVAANQLFSEKPQTSLKARSFTFYSLHFTDLDCSEKKRREKIVKQRILLAYIPLSFKSRGILDDVTHKHPTETKYNRTNAP